MERTGPLFFGEDFMGLIFTEKGGMINTAICAFCEQTTSGLPFYVHATNVIGVHVY